MPNAALPLRATPVASALPVPTIRPGASGVVPIAQVVPLSGAASLLGDAWRSGAEMAAQEANRAAERSQFQLFTYDSAAPTVNGRDSMLRAIEGETSAMLALVPPASLGTALAIAAERRIPVIASGSSWPGAASPWLSLAAPSPRARMARFLAWLRTVAPYRRFAILTASAESPWPEAFRAAAAGGVMLEAVQPPRGSAAAEITRVVRAEPDAVFLDAPPEACGHLLASLRSQAPDLPVLGTAALVAPRTLTDAGTAARLLMADVPPQAGIPALASFTARYTASFKAPPGPLAFEGYVAVAMLRAALRRVTTGNAASLADALRALRTTADETILETAWDETGQPVRTAFVARVTEGGEPEWLSITPSG